MPEFVRVPRPASVTAEPHPLLGPLHRAESAFHRETYGHTDFVDPPAARVVGLAGSPYQENVAFLAVRDGTDPRRPAPDAVLASCDVGLPLVEDVDNALFDLEVVSTTADG